MFNNVDESYFKLILFEMHNYIILKTIWNPKLTRTSNWHSHRRLADPSLAINMPTSRAQLMKIMLVMSALRVEELFRLASLSPDRNL